MPSDCLYDVAKLPTPFLFEGLFPGLRAPALNPPRELVLAPQLDDGVLLRNLRVGVARGLAGFDAAAANFLLPRCQVMLARRKECGPKPGKSQPSAVAALFSA